MRFTRPTVLAASLAASAAAGAPFLAAIGAAPAADPALAETVADVDTMRLVLVKALSGSVRDYMKERTDAMRAEAGAKDEAAKDPAAANEPAHEDLLTLAQMLGRAGDFNALYGLSGTLEANVTSETRGFLARGLGAIFTTEVSVPMRRVEAGASGAAGEGDLWEAALGERGARRDDFFGAAAAREGSRVVIDEAAVDGVVRAAIDAIGRYGSRIEGLADDDVIVVAMHFRGQGFSDLASGESIRGWLAGTLRETRVVELPLAEIRRFAAGAYDLDKLAQRAVVTVYATGFASASGGAR